MSTEENPDDDEEHGRHEKRPPTGRVGISPEAEAWLRHDLPLRALEQECSSLCRDSEFRLYLTRHPSIRAAMETGFYVLAWSGNHPVPKLIHMSRMSRLLLLLLANS